jgi:putative ABC transport system permease protein
VRGALAESGRGAAGGRVRARAGRLLVAGQVALAVVLLVGAGLLGRTLVTLERSGVGHATDARVLTFRVNLVRSRYPDPASRTAFFDALLERMRALPGVRAAGLVGISPWNGWNQEPIAIAGRPAPAGEPPTAAYASVSEGYLATLAIPVRAGRAFGAEDRASSAPVALVSEGIARQHWPGASPVGASIRVGAPDAPWRTVVGVVGDVRSAATADPEPAVYVPASQAPSGGNEFVVRADGDAAALLPAVRAALRELDPALPLVAPRTMDAVFRDSLAGQRLPMLFTTAFATLALVLAALGVYGVMAYAVAARAREFGIRAALGARREGVLWLVLRQGLGIALGGVVVGLAVAAAASRVLAGLLVGVGTHDAVTFVATPLVLLAVAAAACLVPARRATRSDPVSILRAD